METKISLASDFVLFGYVLEGLTRLMAWPVGLTWIALVFGMIAVGLSVKGVLLAKNEDVSKKKLRRAMYYVCLSVLLVAICAVSALK